MNGYVVYVVDTETTGLSSEENEVIELSMSRLIPQDDLSFVEEQKSWLLKAVNPRTISDEALAINGHKREDILHLTKYGKENYLLPSAAIDQIEEWMLTDDVSSMDRIFAGQNPTFDIDMLKALWKRNGRTEEEFPFAVERGNRVIDTKMIVTLFDMCTGKRRKYYGLGRLVKACGVKKDKAHRADADVRMTRDLLLKLVGIIQQPVIEKFSDCYSDDEE